MKILAFSDSHLHLEYMLHCVACCRPDAIIHLGDYSQDAEVLQENYPAIPLYSVSGNCDQYKPGIHPPSIALIELCGVRFYLTHGHKHGVKQSLQRLIADGRASGAHAVLFGHTHEFYVQQYDGLWVINPGSCGFFGSSAALITINNGKISGCRILRQSDLEETL